MLRENRPLTFGIVVGYAAKLALATAASQVGRSWAGSLAAWLREDNRGRHRFDRINADRNDIAHGRTFRTAQEVRDDLMALLHLGEWPLLNQALGPTPCATLSPWIHEGPEGGGSQSLDRGHRLGVLEYWRRESSEYLIPWNGSRFRVTSATSVE